MSGVEDGIDECTNLAVSPDAVVFAALLREHDAGLRAFAWRIVGADVDDVLQDAYLKAFRNWSTFRNECAIGTWLHRIVYTCAVDHLRGRDRQRAVVERLSVQPVTVVDIVDDGDFDIAAALSCLDADERAVLLLVIVQQLSYADAAIVLGVPEGTIGSRLNRARKALRRQIARSTR